MEETKRKKKYVKSYSNTTQKDAESRIGIRLSKLVDKAVDASTLIPDTNENAPEELKTLVFDRLVDAMEAEGFPEASIEPYKEAIVQDFVGDVLRTIVAFYKRKTQNSDIMLTREKEIISINEETGGNMEFVVIDTISLTKDRYLIIIEAKRDALGKGLVQCLLSMKDAYEQNNDGKNVYGFVTTGVDWQLITYSGNFRLSNKMTLLFADLESMKSQWISNNSKIIDIIYKVLAAVA